MNSWKEYEFDKKIKAILTLILAIFFNLITWVLTACLFEFLYNAIGQVFHFPHLGFWFFFWGWAGFVIVINAIRGKD